MKIHKNMLSFVFQRENVREHLDVMRMCAKGEHQVLPEQYFCCRCKEQVINMPEWIVTLSDYAEWDVEQRLIQAPSAEVALYDVLADEIKYLVKEKKYTVMSAETHEEQAVSIDDAGFELILSVHEERHLRGDNKTDKMIKAVLIKLPFLVLFLMFAHYILPAYSPLIAGLGKIVATGLYLTLVMYDFYMINQAYQE